MQYQLATGGTEPQRISDLTPARRWHNTGLYVEHFEPLGAEHQLCALLEGDRKTLIGLGFSRDTVEFSERDVAVVGAAQPYLAGAFRHARELQRLAALLEAAGNVPDAPLSDSPDSVDLSAALSRREQQVVLAIARGLADKQIAAALGISPRTVHKHVEHILDKLGVPNRAAAATFFLRLDHKNGATAQITP